MATFPSSTPTSVSSSEAAKANTDWTSALQHPGNLDRWFDPNLVSALRQRGLTLGPGHCYSPIEPLILGGKMEPENFEVTDWRIHVGLMGQIYQKLKDLPPARSPVASHPKTRTPSAYHRAYDRRSLMCPSEGHGCSSI